MYPHFAFKGYVDDESSFFPKFWTVTFFVILTAKQILRDQALQQQAENQMNLNIMGELTEPEEHGAFRSSINGLTCSVCHFCSKQPRGLMDDSCHSLADQRDLREDKTRSSRPD